MKTPCLHLVPAAVLAAALLCVPAGVANAAEDASDADRAKALYQEARELKEEGRTRESLERLQEAYEVYPADVILISIANRHLDLGEPEEAAEVLDRVTTGSEKLQARVRDLREDVRARLAEPVPVRIDAGAEGSEVSIGGGPFRPLPARVELPRGTHRFEVRAPGHQSKEVERDIRGSIEVPIIVALQAVSGRWRVAIEPSEPLETFRVLIEGEALRLSEAERRKPVTEPRAVPPGTYKVSCLKGYDQRADDVVEVRSGEVAVATCRFDDVDPDGSRVWAWTTAGGSLAAIVGGTAILGEYLATRNEYDGSRYELSSGRQLGLSGALLGTGVALGVVSGLLFAN